MKGKILVVDDERLILLTIERALTKIGFQIFKAANLPDLEAVISRESPFDLLLTDVYLEDTNADDIITRVRAGSPNVKILRMSGAAEVKKGGDFIEKPFRIDALREKVQSLFEA